MYLARVAGPVDGKPASQVMRLLAHPHEVRKMTALLINVKDHGTDYQNNHDLCLLDKCVN